VVVVTFGATTAALTTVGDVPVSVVTTEETSVVATVDVVDGGVADTVAAAMLLVGVTNVGDTIDVTGVLGKLVGAAMSDFDSVGAGVAGDFVESVALSGTTVFGVCSEKKTREKNYYNFFFPILFFFNMLSNQFDC
jgi:hypothetical protein